MNMLPIDNKANEAMDETAYLLSSPANAEHLKKSFEQAKIGKVVSVSLDDIWKL